MSAPWLGMSAEKGGVAYDPTALAPEVTNNVWPYEETYISVT